MKKKLIQSYQLFVFIKPQLIAFAYLSLVFNIHATEKTLLAKDSYLPAIVSYTDHQKPKFTFLVDKSKHQLSIYQTEQNQLQLIKQYTVSTGKSNGNKQTSGDNKTPEGIYFIEKIMEKDALVSKYGDLAFVTNYPNLFDHRSNKDGYGIWLHGLDKELKPMDTQGCVALNNSDIVSLRPYIEIEKTPIFIVNSVKQITPEEQIAQQKKLLDQLNDWQEAWQNKDIERYIKHYSPTFVSVASNQKMNQQQWKKYKQDIFETYSQIEVKLSNLNLWATNEHMIFNFVQHYQCEKFKDQGTKTLYLQKEGDTYKIIAEEWKQIGKTENVAFFQENEKTATVSN